MVLRREQRPLYCESLNGVPFKGSDNSVSGYIFELSSEDLESVQSTIKEILEAGYSRLGGTRVDLDSVLTDASEKSHVALARGMKASQFTFH